MQHGNTILKDEETGQYLYYNGYVFTFTADRESAYPFTPSEAKRLTLFFALWDSKLIAEDWIKKTWNDAAAK